MPSIWSKGRAECRFLQAFKRKDKLVDETLRQRPIINGLICIFCCTETCSSFKLIYGKGCPSHVSGGRPRRVLDFYFLDPTFGQIYISLTRWSPFTVQIYVNGHSCGKPDAQTCAWDSPCVTMPSRL